MLYPIGNLEELEKINELVSLQNQVNETRLQDKLGEQNLQEDVNKVFEPVTKSLKDVSEEVIKVITETSFRNN